MPRKPHKATQATAKQRKANARAALSISTVDSGETAAQDTAEAPKAKKPRKQTPRGQGKRLARPRTRRRAHRVMPSVEAQQAAFLKAYARLGILTASEEASGVDRNNHYVWLADPEKYPNYPARFQEAGEKAADRCEKAMLKRGVIGWDEPVFGSLGSGAGTGVVGKRRMFSDRLLEIALKARRPEKFRERHEVTGKDGGPVQVTFYVPSNGREKP
jgi:hypothetical protein